MNQEQFLKKINIVLVEIDKMINNCDEYSYTNKQQLISIKNELYDMINYLNSESIPYRRLHRRHRVLQD